ncbi:MAG: NAD(P)-dependent oxidoreductase [Pseudonocardiaceae bacterium]
MPYRPTRRPEGPVFSLSRTSSPSKCTVQSPVPSVCWNRNRSPDPGGACVQARRAGAMTSKVWPTAFPASSALTGWTCETLIGKRVLLVGAGDVAERLARRLDGFDLAALSMVGRTGRAGVQSADDLPGLLPSHDVVVLLVPLTSQTVGMVGAEFLAAMPDGAVLVNASRGAVVETSALVAELRSGRLRAVLDVVDPDPLPPGHALWKMPGVLITPHVGGIGTEASWRERAYAVVRDQLGYVVRGRLPPNLVIHGY